MEKTNTDLYKLFNLKKKYPFYNTKGVSGFINKKNHCFFNSILQCLSNSIYLTDYFLSKQYLEDLENKNIEEKNFVNNYFSTIVKIWGKNDIINVSNLLKSLSKIIKKNDYLLSQQDSHECLLFLLNILHKGLSYKVEVEINGDIKNDRDKLLTENYLYYKKKLTEENYSFIYKYFYGNLLTVIKCNNSNCNNKINNFDTFNTLTLNFPKNNEKNLSLYKLLENTLKKETLNYKCEKCKHSQSNKNEYLMKLPNYLIIHLNRFKNESGNISKIDTLVDFPIENLDLTQYFHPSEKNNWIYSLYAVNYHSGTTTNGHYWSSCYNLDNNWYIYNDENTSKYINDKNIVTNEAYILFYYRKYLNT